MAAAGWQPRFHDESLVEWLIVTCYFATAILCVRARRVTLIGFGTSHAYADYDRRCGDRTKAYLAGARFWSLLLGLFLLLGVNKQLDLQSSLTQMARAWSHDQGWYEHRRFVQLALVAIVATTGLAVVGSLLWFARRMFPRLILAFIGTIFLAVYLLTKASSYHHVDAFFQIRIMGVRVYQPLELAGILCVASCALLNCWWHDVRRLLGRLNLGPTPA